MSKRRRRSIFDDILDDLARMIEDAFDQQQDSDPLGQDDPYGAQEPLPVVVSPLTKQENDLYIEIVELGFREAIKRYHPDRGGDAEKAACINALRDKIHAIAGVKK